MTDRTVVVLGAGTGGIVAARRLRRSLSATDRVVLVDRSATFRFAPSFLWVMTGVRRAEQIATDRRRLRKSGIEVIEAEVLEIDVAHRKVKTSAADVSFDRLVIALGAELDPEALPGFADTAHNIYSLAGAASAGAALSRFEGGRLAVIVSRLPYKCPAAPYEAAFLAEALLRDRGVGDRATIDVYTPEPYPMPTAGPLLGGALGAMLAERGITLHAQRSLDRIDAATNELVLTDGERVGYDLLLGVPAHRAPEVLRTSGLAAETGFLPVDRASLATSAEGVFGIGDATAIAIAGGKFLPKAGVFAEAEADVVAANIASELAGRSPTASFDGKGACFVELGDGRAAFASGDFYDPEAPKINLRRPGRRWHLAKVAFEKYWLKRWA
ncbi:MAG: NAD(P)/FAD-dependent oxidoreductase [Actinobacteria bacterium]|nr:NAD(P)/FAD-dependent oxidoreductase [Actinomycetota bacterium]